MTTLTRNYAELVLEVKQHIEADALVQGEYWDGSKGCFIGCLTHSSNPAPAFERFGLPEPLLRIAESIFEGLPENEAKAFFAAFPDAVGRDGKDLTRVHWAFLSEELRALPEVPAGVQAVIDPVIAGMDKLAANGEWPKEEAYAAADAARAAALAADAAAYAADAAAYAAADAAARAAVAADAAVAARAAARAARAAVAARIRQRNTFLRLVREAA
jgi:hypothetical protein